jgi:hypothetical protein
LLIYCLVDAITSRDEDVRHLKKLWWIVLILLFPLVGSIAWLIAGRPTRPQTRRAAPEPPRRAPAADPEADAEFLRRVRERAEEQRRLAKEQKKREESGEDV